MKDSKSVTKVGQIGNIDLKAGHEDASKTSMRMPKKLPLKVGRTGKMAVLDLKDGQVGEIP